MNIKELKRRLLSSLNFNKENVRNLGTWELVSLCHFLDDPSDQNYIEVVVSRLKDERERLIRTDVPKEQWPETLQDEGWEKKIREKFEDVDAKTS